MLDLAKHIVNQKAADFDPERFEDHYEEALTDLINAKRNGKTIAAKSAPTGRERGGPHGCAEEEHRRRERRPESHTHRVTLSSPLEGAAGDQVAYRAPCFCFAGSVG